MTEIENSEEFRSELNQALNDSARLLNQNRPGEAITKLQPFYDKAPTHPDLAINLGGAYILQRKWARAVAVLSKAAAAHPANAMLWTNLAAAELGRLETAGPQQQERAIQAYQQALEADTEAPNVHYHLGLIYKERGEFNRASAFFQRALEVLPSDKDALYWLERLSRQLTEEERAQEQPKRQADTSGAEIDSTEVDSGEIDSGEGA
jgi:tetratricopeptide (TPR) repeat protein